jgi:putative membrane protein insertion efficiency factor
MGELLLRIYKSTVSPLLHAVGVGGACRFQPTCSEYAAIAVHTRGPLWGSLLAVWRVLRCHPFSKGGFDPAPGYSGVAEPSSALVDSQSEAVRLP